MDVDGANETTTEWLENEYNGLSWRTVKRRTTSGVGGTLDEEVQFYYDAGWRIVEERIYEDWSSGSPGSIDRRRNYVWGLRYLDDLCFHRDHAEAGELYTDLEINYYHLTDLQFSTVCLLDETGEVMERVTYDAYGKANHRWRADMDGDGDQDAADEAAVYDLSKFGATPITDAAYEPDAPPPGSTQCALWRRTEEPRRPGSLALGARSERPTPSIAAPPSRCYCDRPPPP